VDAYCERVEPGFWAEPLNAVSNLAFLVAAIAVWTSGRQASTRTLAVLIGLIFLGSAAYHTTATRWGAAADSGFILVFLLYYIILFTHDFAGVAWRLAWLAAPAFVVFTALVALGADAVRFGGPGMYLSALLVLAGIAVWWRGPERRLFALAGAVFTISLTFRTLDEPLCDALPVGTHYAWHVLNAVTLYLVSLAAMRRSRATAARPTTRPLPCGPGRAPRSPSQRP
jgi:hypothetical protein